MFTMASTPQDLHIAPELGARSFHADLLLHHFLKPRAGNL
jgi:hypothetical protein